MRVPEHMVAELIDGELYTSPRPGGPHARASSSLGALLVTRFQFGDGGPGGWWIIDEPELHFDADVLVPDIAGWRTERMPEIPTSHIFSVVPDWVCEVTSPSNGRIDRLKKMPIYARESVAYAWLVNPEQQLLEARRLHDGQWIVIGEYGGADVVRGQPFEEVEIDLTRVWGLPVS
jgi:Uma2 family endonuclease